LTCPGNYYSTIASFECTRCIRKYFYSFDGNCRDCSKGTMCAEDGGSDQINLKISSGYWRISDESTTLYECPLVQHFFKSYIDHQFNYLFLGWFVCRWCDVF
jgi:hypothetical protein